MLLSPSLLPLLTPPPLLPPPPFQDSFSNGFKTYRAPRDRILFRNETSTQFTFYYIAATDGSFSDLNFNEFPQGQAGADPLSIQYTGADLIGRDVVTITLQSVQDAFAGSTVMVGITVIGQLLHT